MHDIKWIRDNSEAFTKALRSRNWPEAKVEETLAELINLDDRRRQAIMIAQRGQEERNALSKQIGQAMGKKDMALADSLKARVAQLKDDLVAAEAEEKSSVALLDSKLLELPNLPLSIVPIGADEHDNVEVRVVGQKPGFAAGFTPKEHFEVGEALGLMDFEAASRMSGARFVVLKGPLARLQRALGQFMLDLHVDLHGYTEIDPTVLVRDQAMFGTAQLPKFREDQFSVHAGLVQEDGGLALSNTQTSADEISSHDHLWLIPTAEVPLTNLVREQILDERQLPIRVTALTPCFRAEAGSAGRDTRGMIRQHQFAKVELVSITTPEASLEEHERMTASAEEVLKRLGLHYRVVTLCTGDMGFASQKTYDIEVWLPGQDRFREISSCSVCGDFQARRMNARYRPSEGDGKNKGTRFLHTLNGSGVAVGRALVAILENYQNADGSLTIPEVLRPYMGGLERIAATA